jgi:hypothetical protein
VTKKEQITYFRDSWRKLKYALSSIHYGEYGNQYMRLIVDEEKAHRRCFRPEGYKCGLTVPEASELFAVKRISEALLGTGWTPTVKDYIHTQKSAFFAYSLVGNYREELATALKDFDLKILTTIDYAELVK